MKKVLITMIVFMMLLMSCTGTVVPAGKIVIIKDTEGATSIITSGVYKAWGRDRAYFLDSKVKTFTEKMKILCADDINMDVDVKFVGNMNIDASNKEQITNIIRRIPAVKVDGEVSGYTISLESFYNLVIKDIIRANSREIVSKLKTDAIRGERKVLQQAIKTAVTEQIKASSFPISVNNVMISNIDYPKSVTAQREAIKTIQLEELKKDASAKAELAEAKRRVEVETQKAKVRIIKAKAIAAENKIIAGSLTNKYLNYLEIAYMADMSSNESKDKVFIPYGTKNSLLLGK